MNKNGFTVYELLIGFVFLIIMSYFLLTTIFSIRDNQQLTKTKSQLLDLKITMTKDINDDLLNNNITDLSPCSNSTEYPYCINITYTNNVTKKLRVDVANKIIYYGNTTYELLPDSYIDGKPQMYSEVPSTSIDKRSNALLIIDIPVSNYQIKGNFGIHIVYLYNSSVYGWGQWSFENQ